MKLLFIMNPTSGRTSNDKAILSIHALAAQERLDFKFLYTSGEHDDKAITEELAAYKPDRVVACGGDGTVQLVARNLVTNKIPMGILPLGSANGLAKALDLPQTIDEALDVIVHSPQIIPLDFLMINNVHICIHMSDIGTNALLVKNYEEAGDKGMLGYAKHLISSIKQSDLMHYTITTPEGTYKKEGFMLVIANAHKYGTGVHISEGSVSDGRFEICNIQTIDLESAIKAGLTAINVFIDKDMFSDVISCKEAHIKINKKVHLQIDGEYIGKVNDLKIKIIPSAINVLVKK